MHPVLFELGSLRLPSYGSLLVAGFLAGMLLAARLAPRLEVGPREAAELARWLVLGGSLGSRLFFIVEDVDPFLERPWEALYLWRGGAVWYGGVLGGLMVLVHFARRHRVSLWDLGDLFSPSLSLAHVFGRLGCFAAGCCFGRPTAVPWAVVFPEGGVCRLPGTPLHPTQLYEAAGEIGILLLLLHRWRHRPFPGAVFLTYGIAYPCLRILVELFRGDAERGFLVPGLVSWPQAVSAVLLLAAAATWCKKAPLHGPRRAATRTAVAR